MVTISKHFSAPALIAGAAVTFSGCSTTTEITTPHTESTYLSAPAAAEIDFTPLFDGRSLRGWKLIGKKGAGYGVKDGVLFCAAGGGGKLLTEKEYANFILRFDFRLSEGANNGVAIRAPFTDKALAYDGMELQILDDTPTEPAKTRRPTQYHGSLYDVLPAKHGALRPAGEWNVQEIIAKGRQIRVAVNGKVILEADLNSITDPAVIQKHPGLFRERGHLGFMGHNDFCEFRNIRIRELPSPRVYNRADDGFDQLFTGRDLQGWYGSFDPTYQTTAAGDRAKEVNRRISDLNMQTHWSVRNNALVHDGQGGDIFSESEYGDFELAVEYKVEPGGTGGILPLGLPGVVVQDRDTQGNDLRLGSGGLHDGGFFYKAPGKYADRFAGAWNRMRVIMAGGRAHVFVNNELVVKNAAFKNPGQRDTPLPTLGPIGIASGWGRTSYRSIYARGIAGPAVVKSRPKPAALPELEAPSKPGPKAAVKTKAAPPAGTVVDGAVVTEFVGPTVVAPKVSADKAGKKAIGEMKLIDDR